MARFVRICTISLNSLCYNHRNKEQSWDHASKLIDEHAGYQPDIVLLPEFFLVGDYNDRFNDPEYIEYYGSPMLKKIAAKAAMIKCYIAAPLLFRDETGLHNSTVFFDRGGKVVHIYHKMFLTDPELDRGIVPGPTNPSVFHADFGRIAFAICFDLSFEAFIGYYRDQKIDLLLFSSYFPGGGILRQMAFKHSFFAVTSHAQGYRSVVIDDYGREVATASIANPALCWKINLDTAILHITGNYEKIGLIYSKYQDWVKVEVLLEEGLMRLECNLPDKTVDDVITECGLIRIKDYLLKCAKRNDGLRSPITR